MILVIDNYDSFTFNLVHYLMELGAEVRVERNDALSAAEAMASGAQGVLISPGPCTPNEAGISLDLGGRVVRGGLMHGKTSPVEHDGSGVFAGLPNPFTATRYHSLVVEDVPAALAINARSETPGLDGTCVMGFRHRDLPIHGVQFHPESIATDHGHALLANFLRLCGIEPRLPARAAA